MCISLQPSRAQATAAAVSGQDWCLGSMCSRRGDRQVGGGLGARCLARGAASDAGVAQVLGAALSGNWLEGFQLQLFLGVLEDD